MEKMENKEGILEIAEKNFKDWNDALQTKDANKVAELYSVESTFLPTLSGDFKMGKNGAGNYFEHFLLKNPFGKIIEDKVQILGSESYVHSGLYNFDVGPTDDRQVAEARFTFVWKKINGEWKIIHHHSSIKPKN